MHTYTLKSWYDFLGHDAVKAVEPAFKSDMLFRGQSHFGRPLWPSLIRAIGKENRNNARRALKLEEIAQEEFASQAYLFLPPTLMNARSSVVRWWTVMQHYGAPTRLLDWSLSPFVAAYFACAGSDTDAGAIWVLNMQSDNFMMPPDFDLDTDRDDGLFLASNPEQSLHLLLHGPRNERMIAQQGVFMLSADVLAKHDEVLSRLPRPTKRKWTFGQLIVPSNLKPEFLLNLGVMNITARSLFPGIDGLGKSIFDTIRLEGLTKRHRSEY